MTLQEAKDQIAKKYFNMKYDDLNDADRKAAIIDAVAILIHSEACREQREICADKARIINDYGDYIIDKDSIKDAPEPPMNTETITDNEVIARFMGALKKYDEQGGMPCVLLSGGGVPVSGWYFNDKEILYSTSWEWLMPVWYKFRDISFDGDKISHHPVFCEHYNSISNAILNYGPSPSEACKLLADGIRWYNSTQNKEQS